MVWRTLILLNRHNKKKNTFIDSLRLNVKGGLGGNGAPKYGGIGGQGGCVKFVADEGYTLKGLAKFRGKPLKGGGGEDSTSSRLLGRRGDDKVISVPVGITVLDENKKKLAELNEVGDSCIAAGGGMGGCSGTEFVGRKGQERVVTLDLKLIADVGLVGFPNAGKSTLLKAVSRASPKIAAYPFTTLQPQIGNIMFDDLRQISIADLPGLIEGAHKNIGMGHKFLKHIERTKLLLMMVDLHGFQLSSMRQFRNCIENVYALNKELELYDADLLNRPCILLLNKIDIDGAQAEYEEVKDIVANLESHKDVCPDELKSERFIQFDDIHVISAKNQIGIDTVKQSIRSVLDKHAEIEMDKPREKIERNNEKNGKQKWFYS